MEFDVGKEFEEDLTGVDDRKCMTTVSWDGDKLLCVQNGEKEGRGWTQWIEGDEMHLEIRVCGVKCKQVFKKVQWASAATRVKNNRIYRLATNSPNASTKHPQQQEQTQKWRSH